MNLPSPAATPHPGEGMKSPAAHPRILLIDDDRNLHELCRRHLERAGYVLVSAYDGGDGLEKIRQGEADLVLLDVRLPGMDGYAVYQEMVSNPDFRHVRHLPVIMLTAFPGSDSRRNEFIELGVSMHLEKPFGSQELIKVIQNVFVTSRVRESERRRADQEAREVARVCEENRALRSQIIDTLSFRNIVGNSPQMRETLDRVLKVAKTEASILIYGESGTGKELIARSIHAHSHRSDGPFVIVDCAALPGNLLESEIFGHETGAFTGVRARKGFFEIARGGTLYLDEITALNRDIQAKILRALQERQFCRLGGKEMIEADFRVISATIHDPGRAVEEKKLRHDLYYRLNVIPISLPPLRERKDDIPLLCRTFVQKFAKAMNRPEFEVSTGTLDCLMRHSWPENIRELQTVIVHAVSLASGPQIEPSDLPEYLRQNLRPSGDETTSAVQVPASPDLPLREARQKWMEKFERDYLIELLNRYNGNISRVARKAGVHRMTIYRMLKNYQITVSPRRVQ